ncbi:hypothetical protein P8452_04346 [Trifolium repens]|nr:hypothetical protein P8452_04346 [Trifolium repens]
MTYYTKEAKGITAHQQNKNKRKRTNKMAEAVVNDSRKYDEYGIDLTVFGKEDGDRLLNFISSNPKERKIRSPYVQSDLEYRYRAYFDLNELLWLFESPRTPRDILLTQSRHTRLQQLVNRLRAASFEGSWLDDVEKLLVFNHQNINQEFEALTTFERVAKELSKSTGEQIELLTHQKSCTNATKLLELSIGSDSSLRKPSLLMEEQGKQCIYEEYGFDLNFMTKEEVERVIGFISAEPEERKFRNSDVQSFSEYRNLGYYYLNELLCLLDASNTILLSECNCLQHLVIKLRRWSFEGTWLDEIEKLPETKNMEKQLIAQEDRCFKNIALSPKNNSLQLTLDCILASASVCRRIIIHTLGI